MAKKGTGRKGVVTGTLASLVGAEPVVRKPYGGLNPGMSVYEISKVVSDGGYVLCGSAETLLANLRSSFLDGYDWNDVQSRLPAWEANGWLIRRMVD